MAAIVPWSLQQIGQELVLQSIKHVLRLPCVLFRVHNARSIAPNQIQVPLNRVVADDVREAHGTHFRQRNQHSRTVLPALAHHRNSGVELLGQVWT